MGVTSGTPESGTGDAPRPTLSEVLAAMPVPKDRIDWLVRFLGEQFGGVVTTIQSAEARLTIVEAQVAYLMGEIERLRISSLEARQ